MDKDRLLQAMVEGRVRWEEALASVPEERMLEPAFEGGWSMKDVIAHIAEWANVAATRLEYGLGQRSTPADFEGMEIDARNARFFERNRDVPLNEVQKQEAANWERLLAMAKSLSQEQLDDPSLPKGGPGHPPWDMIAGNAHEHFDEHIEQIHAWLGEE
jgi:hypothetical protein